MAFIILFALLYFLFPYIAYREMRYGRSLEPDAAEELATHGVIRRQGRMLMTWSLIAAGIALLSVFPLMGLPGGFLLEFYRWIGLSARAMDVHRIWPAAVYASVLWPIAIPAGVYLRQRMVRHVPAPKHGTDRGPDYGPEGTPRFRYAWVVPAVVAVWVLVVGVIIRLTAGG